MSFKISDLAEELPRENISWRVQGKPYERNGAHSAMALAYIDARDVMDRLDSVCGPENWQDQYEVTNGGLTICRIGIFINDQWIWKSDGAGETAVEGKKGGLSDALKRTAVKWGIGRYLYRLDSPWVKCEVKPTTKGVTWKKWAEDPWQRVKNAPYVVAEDTRNVQNQEELFLEAKGALQEAKTLDELIVVWKKIGPTMQRVPELEALKQTLKSQFPQQKAT